jgi:uncharacterized membrane protein
MIFWVLLLLAIPFVLPLVSLISQSRIRGRLSLLEQMIEGQRATIDSLERRLRSLTEPKEERPRAPVPDAPPVPAARPPVVVSQSPAPVAPPTAAPVPVVLPPPEQVAPPPPVVARPSPLPPLPPAAAPPRLPSPIAAASEPPSPPSRLFTTPAFDWENLVGVKLFSAIAGIALVLAAVFFLRYSMDHGWLAPPVRVAIGIIVAIALLVMCERKAARQYPVTANALDAAAIAILFSTFFSAHALWHLIPAAAAFVLLALVTVVAVLLSIRRDSLFISVLGLLGGFATPALLSTGENRPIPLFTYLLMLNLGLAWVASRKKWPVLSVLTLVLTAIYQWGWVVRFLTVSQLSLAMGIFLIFAIASFVALTLGRAGDTPMDVALERTGLGASAMPLVFAIYLAAVPAYGARAGMLFGFLLMIDAALLAVSLGRRQGADHRLHAVGAGATLLVFAIWLAVSYASSAWITVTLFTAAFGAFYALAPMAAALAGRPLTGVGARAVYAAPILLFVFPVIARIEPAVAEPFLLFGTLFALLALIAWRALATQESGLYFIAAFFAVAAEASWSATFLSADHLRAAIVLYVGFGVFYLGVPLMGRRLGRGLEPRWAPGALLIASLALLLFLAAGDDAAASLWGLALLLAILDAGLFIESAAGGLPWLSAAGAVLSWVVLAVWWENAAAVVGLLPSLLVLIGLTLIMLIGHGWAHAQIRQRVGEPAATTAGGFQHGIYLALVGHLFLFYVAQDARWSMPPWPLLGSLAVLTLATSVSSLAVKAGELHAAGVTAAAVVVLAWARLSLTGASAPAALAAIETVIVYALVWLRIAGRARAGRLSAGVGAACTLFVGEITLIAISISSGSPGIAIMTLAHVANISLILALAWRHHWPYVAPAAVVPAFFASMAWHDTHPEPAAWKSVMLLAGSLYAVFTAYPFVLHRRARDNRDPHVTAVAASVFLFLVARAAFAQGGLTSIVGVVPVGEAAVLALLLRELLSLQAPGARDLGRLALVAGAALAFVTVAIPLQLKQQWVTIGWALEGAALSWLYRRIPHRGLLCWAVGLLSVAFSRLALNPAIFVYEPRGMRVFNWYLYTYLVCGAALFLAGWWLSKADDRIASLPRASSFLPVGGVILLFLLLNIEIADFYATGPEITFRFGVTLAQDLTYTIGWLIFGLVLLTAGIYLHNRPGRIAAIALIAVTTFKAFLYDMASLGGLYRVASLVGLAVSLSLVALALQKVVLQAPKEAS